MAGVSRGLFATLAAAIGFLVVAATAGSRDRRLFTSSEPSSLDAVRLALLKSFWAEPTSYRGSGASIPEEWRAQFEKIVGSPDVSNREENSLREKLLNHVSYRTAALISTLPPMSWTVGTLKPERRADLATFRIVGDSSWDSEFEGSECLTAGAVSQALEMRPVVGAPTTSTHGERVAALRKSNCNWPSTLVAIGESPDGPFTLLDGNHRAVLLAGEAHSGAGCPSTDPVLLFVGVPEGSGQPIGAEGTPEKTWKFWRDCEGVPESGAGLSEAGGGL